jgi:hypothetical protein
MIEVTQHVIKLRFLQSHPHISLKKIYVCEQCGKAYVLRFQDGASREHCSDEACRLSHGVSAALRNRINSKIRMRLIRAMGGA